MTLLLDLVRHADALPKAHDGGDAERALSPLGHRQSLMLAERLRERGGYPQQVWCSPATRTRQTLSALPYDFTASARFEPRLYEAELDTLLDIVAELRPLASHALLVAHNPGLQDLATWLVGLEAPEMRTAATVRIQLPARPERPLRGQGKLVDAWKP